MTPVYNFTWRGEDAFADHGVCVMKIGSSAIAERRDQSQAIAGRSGLVHMQDGAVEEVERSLKLYLPYGQGGAVSSIQTIRKWLKGYGQLSISTLPGRYMMAYITDMIDFAPLVEGFADLQGDVIFRCAPYLYHKNAPAITLTSPAVKNNPGDAPAAPRITVNATGDIDLMIGGQTVLLNALTGQIILDSEAQEAYVQNTGGGYASMNAHMAGDFPLIQPGSFAVSWSLGEGATLTSVKIEPRWRDEH